MRITVMMRRIMAGILLAVIMIGMLPLHPARAEEVTPASRHDQRFVDVQPGDIDIWDNGTGISVSSGGETYTMDYWGNEYVVLVSKYLDTDGQYTLQADIYFYGGVKRSWYSNADLTTDDGSVYFYVQLQSAAGMFSSDQGRSYCIKLRDGLFLTSNGEWTASPTCYSSASTYNKYGGDIGSPVFASPFYAKKYIVYSSYEYTPTSTTETGFPVNLLPNAPLGAGTTAIPYKTTFRMLTDGATVYNTFYYTSSYMSGADAISASGTIRCDATKLSDGSVTRTVLTAPQLLCQVSSYGTTYDIVYTNDDNLCKLLGINRPQELRWNVAMQRWVSVAWDDLINSGTSDGWDDLVTDVITPDNTNPFNPDDAIPAITGLSVSPIGMDARILYEDYSTLYGNALLYLAEDTSVKQTPWGLGSSLSWTIGDNGSGHKIDLRIAARVTVQLSDGKTRYHTLIIHDYSGRHPGNNKNWSVSAESGQCRVALYDLIILLQQQYKDYNNHPPARLLDVQYALTPFYTDGGKYYRGKTAYTTQVVDTAYQSVPVDNTIPTIPDPWDPIVDGSVWDAIKDLSAYIKEGIADAIEKIGSFFGSVLRSATQIWNLLGSVPALLSKAFIFLPEEIVMIIGVGLSLWLLPALLRLARGGLKALGGLASSLFSLISSFF